MLIKPRSPGSRSIFETFNFYTSIWPPEGVYSFTVNLSLIEKGLSYISEHGYNHLS